jgi:hypothetical protein
MTRTSLQTGNRDSNNKVLEWRHDQKLRYKYGTRMDVWAHATVKIWYYNGDMGVCYSENMVL